MAKRKQIIELTKEEVYEALLNYVTSRIDSSQSNIIDVEPIMEEVQIETSNNSAEPEYFLNGMIVEFEPTETIIKEKETTKKK